MGALGNPPGFRALPWGTMCSSLCPPRDVGLLCLDHARRYVIFGWQGQNLSFRSSQDSWMVLTPSQRKNGPIFQLIRAAPGNSHVLHVVKQQKLWRLSV